MCDDLHDLIQFYHSQPNATVIVTDNDGVTVKYELGGERYHTHIECEADVIDLILFYINNKG